MRESIVLEEGDFMKKLVIEGKRELSGVVNISGAKNSVVALIPAAMLTDGKCIIRNVPNISDVRLLIEMMKLLGSDIKLEDDVLYIDNSHAVNHEIDTYYASKMRASYYFMGVLLSKYGYAKISYPGGCTIGARPINFHVNGFERLGAKVNIIDQNIYEISADKLVGNEIFLDMASVGATINIMFASVKAKGKTRIHNAAKEPEIINIADFLNSMGAKVTGAGTSEITIEGVDSLHDGEITVIPDRIEAGTYVIMGALMGNNLVIEGVVKDHLDALFIKLSEAGCNFKIEDNKVIISKADSLKPVNIKTLVYPGFPTDLGQPMSTLLTQCEGDSLFEETIYENRMRHIKYLNEMGANIDLDGKIAVIHGKTELTGKNVEATDLRAGAAMLVAGMLAEGKTEITNIEHILRGYENIVGKLSAVGASVKLVDE